MVDTDPKNSFSHKLKMWLKRLWNTGYIFYTRWICVATSVKWLVSLSESSPIRFLKCISAAWWNRFSLIQVSRGLQEKLEEVSCASALWVTECGGSLEDQDAFISQRLNTSEPPGNLIRMNTDTASGFALNRSFIITCNRLPICTHQFDVKSLECTEQGAVWQKNI